MLAAAIVLAPYVRMLAEQQATIAALEADVAEREVKVDELAAELDRWNDPAFVTARARERLFMVMPGETGYVVLDPPSEEELSRQGAASVVRAAEEGGEVRPWFGALWESVELAGSEVRPPQPAPRPGSGSGSGSGSGPVEGAGDVESEPAPDVAPVP